LPQHRFCQVWEALDGTRCPLRCDDAGSIDRRRLIGGRTRFLGQKRTGSPACRPETNAGKTGSGARQGTPSGQGQTERNRSRFRGGLVHQRASPFARHIGAAQASPRWLFAIRPREDQV
jgi:hypothetical protein